MSKSKHSFSADRRSVLKWAAGAGIVAACSAEMPASGGHIRTSMFRSLNSAFAAWSEVGGTLLIDGDAEFTRPITVLAKPNLRYRLVADGPRSLRYFGPRYHWALCIYSEGLTELEITGPLAIDGDNRVCMPLFVRFGEVAGSRRRNCTVDGLTTLNARMESGRSPVDGSPTNSYGASGMLFSGGFDRLVLRNVAATNVTRARDAGRPGSQGCVGIGVTADMRGTKSARHVLIEDFSVTNIDSEDGTSSPARGDMDGVLVFQSPETGGTRPIIRRGKILNAAGRAVKVFAPGGGGITEHLEIFRSRPGGPVNGAVDIAHQHGDGMVRDVRITYAGSAHANNTTVVGFSSGTKRLPGFPFGPAVVENLQIRDTTGVPKYAIFGLQYNVPGDAYPRSFSATSVFDEGLSRYLFLPGALGTHGTAQIDFSEIDVNLTAGVLASEDPTQRLRLSLDDVRLTGRTERRVPLKVLYNDRIVPAHLAIPAKKSGKIMGLM